MNLPSCTFVDSFGQFPKQIRTILGKNLGCNFGGIFSGNFEENFKVNFWDNFWDMNFRKKSFYTNLQRIHHVLAPRQTNLPSCTFAS